MSDESSSRPSTRPCAPSTALRTPCACTARPAATWAVLEREGSFYACDHFVDEAHLIGNLEGRALAELGSDPRMRAFGEAKRKRSAAGLPGLRPARVLQRRLPQGPRRGGPESPLRGVQALLRALEARPREARGAHEGGEEPQVILGRGCLGISNSPFAKGSEYLQGLAVLEGLGPVG